MRKNPYITNLKENAGIIVKLTLRQNIKNIIFTLTLHVLFVGVIFAQTEFESESDVAKKAAGLFGKEEYVEALPLYSQLLSLHPKDPYYNYTFGVCLLFGDKRDTEKPIRYLEFAAKNLNDRPEVHYFLGMAYHVNYRFSEAIKQYNYFIDNAGSTLRRKFNAERSIEMCENGISLLNTINDLYILEKTEVPKKNFYRSYNVEEFNGKFLFKPANIKSKIDKKRDDKSILFFSDTNEVIYFSSYGDDKKGSKDIYRSFKQADGNWSIPERLDSVINTEYDEDYPYILPDGKTLYFSSKGHNSMGGYDIFKSVYDMESKRWSKPENLDFAINTPFDDILFVSDSAEKYACFSSARSSVDDHITVYKVRIDKRPVIKENLALDLMIADGEADKNGEYKATLSYIKELARMDVNTADDIPDETLIAEKAIVDEKDSGQLKEEAGLKEKLAEKIEQRTLNEKMVDTAFAIVEMNKTIINTIKQKKLSSFVVASQKRKLAGLKYRQSEQLFSGAEAYSDEQSKTNTKSIANELRKESAELEKEAKIAENIGNQLEKQQAYKEKELERFMNYAGDIQKLVAVENTDSSVVLLNNLFAEVRSADTLTDFTGTETYLKGIAENDIIEAFNHYNTAELLQKEAVDLENRAFTYLDNADKESRPEGKSELLQKAKQLAKEAENKRKESIAEKEKGREAATKAGDDGLEALFVYKVVNEVYDINEMDEQELAILAETTEMPETITSSGPQTQTIELNKRLEQYEPEITAQKASGKEVAENIISQLNELIEKLDDEEEYLRQSSEAFIAYSAQQQNLAIKKTDQSDSLLTLISIQETTPELKSQNLDRAIAMREEALQHQRESVAAFEVAEYFKKKTEEKLYETALLKSKAEEIHAMIDAAKTDEAQKAIELFETETKQIITDTEYPRLLTEENKVLISERKAQHDGLIREAEIQMAEATKQEKRAAELRKKAEEKRSDAKKEALMAEAENLDNEVTAIKNQAEQKSNAASNLMAEIKLLESKNSIAESILPKSFGAGADTETKATVTAVDKDNLSQYINDLKENDVFAKINTYTQETVSIAQLYTAEIAEVTDPHPRSEIKTDTVTSAPSGYSVEEAEKEIGKAYLISRSVDLINSEITRMKSDLADINDERQKEIVVSEINQMQHLADSLTLQAYEIYKRSEKTILSEGKYAESLAEQYNDQSLAFNLQEEAYDGFSQVNRLRNQALSTNDVDLQKSLAQRADDIEEIAMYKQLEVFEVFGIGNRNNYYANKIILNRIRIDDSGDERLRIARELEEEAQYYYEQALYYRYKSKQADLPYDQKLVFLQEANSLELQALEKQKEAIGIFRQADRRAPSDSEILAERVVQNKILESDEQEISEIRDRLAGISAITTPELAIGDIKSDEAPELRDVIEEVVVEEPKVTTETSQEDEQEQLSEAVVEEESEITDAIAITEEEYAPGEDEPNRDLVDVVVDRPKAFVTFYNDEYPIPVNPGLPTGLIFKVQIAAFRNPIPQNTFSGISPISAEKVPGSAFTRYLAGLFYNIDEATESRNQLRQIGYPDAFVVAYLNGQRISLTQARELIRREEVYTASEIASEFQLSQEYENRITDEITTTEPATAAAAPMPSGLPPEEIEGASEYYSVQIGAFSKPVTVRQLLNLEPIWYNRLQNGLWRYISGIYATSEEATFARDLIRNRGIKDAFVVKYDDAGRRSFTRLMKEGEQQQRQQQEAAAEESRQEARGGRQVVSDESGDIRFMVQIAAYKDGAPFGMIDTYFTSLNIPFSRQRNNDGITVYITGSYSDYKSAEEYKNEIVRKGLSDAFVVAYSNNQRISIQQALNLLNESND